MKHRSQFYQQRGLSEPEASWSAAEPEIVNKQDLTNWRGLSTHILLYGSPAAGQEASGTMVH